MSKAELRVYRSELEVPMLGLVRNTFPGRTVPQNFGKFYSLVLTGTCNFRCDYCDVQGYAIDDRNWFPGTYTAKRSDIEKFNKLNLFSSWHGANGKYYNYPYMQECKRLYWTCGTVSNRPSTGRKIKIL